MNRNRAAAALAALLYAQGLLGVAALGAVLLKSNSEPAPAVVRVAADTTVIVR